MTLLGHYYNFLFPYVALPSGYHEMAIIAKKADFFQFGLMVYKEFSLILSFSVFADMFFPTFSC
jgi:hypothetical protein